MAVRASELQTITRDDLRDLAAATATSSVSLFMPMRKDNVEPEENSLHLKNLLGDARRQLDERQIRTPDIEQLLEPIEALLEDRDFWKHQLRGLAILRTAEDMRVFTIPVELEERCYVGDRYVVRPLVAATTAYGDFYILCLSQGQIRLLHATAHDIEELDLTGLDIPLNLDEAMRFDDEEKPAWHNHPTTGPAGGVSSRDASQGDRALHGHGAGAQDEKVQLLRYFQMVDPGIMKVLKGSNSPLILAGVEYLHPLYKEVSAYQHILEDGVTGNADGWRPGEIHQRALPIFEARIADGYRAMGERYGDLASHGKASSSLDDILASASQGRVEYLFVARNEERWGLFDAAAGRASIRSVEDRQAGDVELLDLAIRLTLQTSGTTFLLEAEDMPGTPPIAAIYRY